MITMQRYLIFICCCIYPFGICAHCGQSTLTPESTSGRGRGKRKAHNVHHILQGGLQSSRRLFKLGLFRWILHHILHGFHVGTEARVLHHFVELFLKVGVLDHLGHVIHDVFVVQHGFHGAIQSSGGRLFDFVISNLEHVFHLGFHFRLLARVGQHFLCGFDRVFEFFAVLKLLHFRLEFGIVHHGFGLSHHFGILHIAHELGQHFRVLSGILESFHTSLDITEMILSETDAQGGGT
mmetsp:Transcript_17077/g.35348  ORF Transcript_17077/g.35348 Transcript_17077/m.35348 type:complete len:237 (-) Transcript_17077:125-835(-)